jgi:1-acyl-sn-glycerol-3-phosphate acyltransferase
MIPRFLRWIFNLLSLLLTRREIHNLENVPKEGPCILALNHLSYFDLPFIFGLIGGENVTGWAAEKYARHPLFGPILRLGGGIFIERGQVDRSALDSAIDWLEQGNLFGMAPEGTRSKTGKLARGKTGAAYLAHETGAPILPLAITGTEKTLQSWLHMRRPTFTLRVGELFRLPPLDPERRAASLHEHTDEIMCRIAALLPPEYHGHYADHPLLQELLASRRRETRPPRG